MRISLYLVIKCLRLQLLLMYSLQHEENTSIDWVCVIESNDLLIYVLGICISQFRNDKTINNLIPLNAP
jgi:hypothetical protein